MNTVFPESLLFLPFSFCHHRIGPYTSGSPAAAVWGSTTSSGWSPYGELMNDDAIVNRNRDRVSSVQIHRAAEPPGTMIVLRRHPRACSCRRYLPYLLARAPEPRAGFISHLVRHCPPMLGGGAGVHCFLSIINVKRHTQCRRNHRFSTQFLG